MNEVQRDPILRYMSARCHHKKINISKENAWKAMEGTHTRIHNQPTILKCNR